MEKRHKHLIANLIRKTREIETIDHVLEMEIRAQVFVLVIYIYIYIDIYRYFSFTTYLL